MAVETEVGTEEVRRLTFADRIRSLKDAIKHLNRGPMEVVVLDVARVLQLRVLRIPIREQHALGAGRNS